ncbi:MAG: ABC transporter ATP-binding protein [Vicinamibacteraceae bacterium]|nr:ABC transporter ATP-binding protein [Vicinamibacteraceae bacterium]
MIETTELTRVFGTTVALDRLSFRAEPGEILGFLGPNGAGKSTTVRILTGMIRPTSGRALVAGIDVVENPIEVKRRIGYVPESGAVYETLSGDEYLELVGALHSLDRRVARARADELLSLVGLGEERRQQMSTYSKGMKQKVLIAAALLHRPEVLLFDEPLNGLDANASLLVKELLRGLAAQGRTVLFCSHILEVVERMCTRILVISHGRKLAEGTPEDLLSDTGTASLDLAFARLTGGEGAAERTADFLSSMGE